MFSLYQRPLESVSRQKGAKMKDAEKWHLVRGENILPKVNLGIEYDFLYGNLARIEFGW